jgi:release factor glutamine methyltransferase
MKTAVREAMPALDARASALVELGRALLGQGYHFVTVTPDTHRRVNRRAARAGRATAQDLRDVFGWSRPFHPQLLSPALLELASAAGAVVADGSELRPTVRFSSLAGGLFIHSAYPTLEGDSVFFGPDTYRFCSFVGRQLARAPRVGRLCEVGCGSGAVGLVMSRHASKVVLADISARALMLARVNAALAGIEVEVVPSDVLAGVDGTLDVVIANPPYMLDEARRTYRDGGGAYGEALAVRIVRQALTRLSRGGTLLLYTGAAIVGGDDTFLRAVRPLLANHAHHYEELDPDVFGEELERPPYAEVERIAAVGLTVSL